MGPTCGSCRHITRTSPDQVFLRCEWHCAEPGGDLLRCHVQPWAPRCRHYVLRDGDALAEDIERMVRNDVPYEVAVATVLRGVAS